jgi:3-hydroxy-9,10-secoandrosta-1,3,5(10)-triene-9,17-dione monooxygenase
VLVAIQILVNVHGAGSFAESSPMQQFWRDANTAARHTALNTIIRHKVYGKALLGVDEVVTRLV